MASKEQGRALVRGERGRRWCIEESPAHTGGQALVHFGEDADSGEPAAFKVAIEPGDAGAWLDGERALLEELAGMPTLRGLVVPVLDHGTWGSRRWFAMPRFDDTLASFVAKGPPLGERLAAALAVVEAVAALHRAGDGSPRFVHGDVKPSNVMRAPDGWRLADFGAARAAAPGASTDTGAFFSRGFAPPEQALPFPQAPTPAWDVFALAATTCFCILGRPAVAPLANGLCLTPLGRRAVARRDAGGLPAAALLDHARMRALDAEDRRDLAAAVGPGLVRTLEAMLAPDARRRVGTPDTLATALRAEITRPGAGRRRWGAPVLATAALVSIVAALAALSPAPTATPPAVPVPPTPARCPPGSTPDGERACVTPAGRMARVSAGRFAAGSGADARIAEVGRPFLVGETEVTQALWREVTGEDPVGTRRFARLGSVFEPCAGPALEAANGDMPVFCVTVAETVALLAALSTREGLTPACAATDAGLTCDPAADGYRLPTGDEWELAARAGTTGELPGPGTPCDWGNVADTTMTAAFARLVAEEPGLARELPAQAEGCDDGYAYTAPVGRFRANRWGLRDVVGNVSELVLAQDGGLWARFTLTDAVAVRPVAGDVGVWGLRLARSLPPADEVQVVRVDAAGVDVAVREVTQGEWRALLGEEPVRDRIGADQRPCAERQGVSLVGDDRPVVCVTWLEAARFANARSARDGLAPAYRVDGTTVTMDAAAPGWRLPTLAEWRAAFGDRTFPGTDDPAELCRFANVLDADAALPTNAQRLACHDGAPALAPVATRPPNEHQLFDLAGNAAEWAWDPVDDDPGLRAVVGGGWRNPADTDVPAAYTREGAIGLPADTNDPAVGLRLVRTAR